MKGIKKHLELRRSDTSKVLKLPYHCILTIKPSPDWEKKSFIKTAFKDKHGKEQWFNVEHSYAEILDMYYEIKKNVGGR